jgi:HprK-related kinase A
VKLSQLSPAELVERTGKPGICIQTGPFIFHLQTSVAQIIEGLRLLYADFPIFHSPDCADFHIRIVRLRQLRRRFRPQARFYLDEESPFAPVPAEQAYAMFEWGLNWCISSHANQYLIIHAAAVERDGYAVILPGPPGAGKSTLCAALVIRGWRLLTDELTLVDLVTRKIVPLARPIALKNESLRVIQQMAPGSVFGPACSDTAKGTVAHLRPPTESLMRVREQAQAGWVIFPKYTLNGGTDVRPMAKGQTFMWFAGSSFNYTLLGREGFETLSGLMDRTDCFAVDYSNLDQVIPWFDSLKPPKPVTGVVRARTDAV